MAIFDLNEKAGREQVNRLKSQGLHVQFFHVDVTSPEQIQKAVAAFAEENQGQIHHLINGGLFGILLNSRDIETFSIFSGLLRLKRFTSHSERFSQDIRNKC